MYFSRERGLPGKMISCLRACGRELYEIFTLNCRKAEPGFAAILIII